MTNIQIIIALIITQLSSFSILQKENMIVIPLKSKSDNRRGPLVFVLILEKENLERMKLGDPLDFKMDVFKNYISPGDKIENLDFVIAYEEDKEKLLEFRNKNDFIGLIEYLERGRVIKEGDLDKPKLI